MSDIERPTTDEGHESCVGDREVEGAALTGYEQTRYWVELRNGKESHVCQPPWGAQRFGEYVCEQPKSQQVMVAYVTVFAQPVVASGSFLSRRTGIACLQTELVKNRVYSSEFAVCSANSSRPHNTTIASCPFGCRHLSVVQFCADRGSCTITFGSNVGLNSESRVLYE